jgi:hypothetical protein
MILLIFLNNLFVLRNDPIDYDLPRPVPEALRFDVIVGQPRKMALILHWGA